MNPDPHKELAVHGGGPVSTQPKADFGSPSRHKHPRRVNLSWNQ